MESDYPMPGKAFNIAVASVAAVTVIAAIVVPLAMGLSASESDELAKNRDALHKANSRKGALPTPDAVKKFEKYRDDLEGVRKSVGDFFENRDGNLERFFPEYDPRSGGDRYRQLYKEKTRALYTRAVPVLVRDQNGKPAPAAEIFAFEAWEWSPGTEEVRLAQVKFNVSQAVVDVLLDLGSKAADAVKASEIHLSPRLLTIRVKSPPPDQKAEIISPVSGTVDVMMDPRDVPALLSEIVGPGKHGLLMKLASISVKKTGTLEMEYEEVIPEGQTPRLKPTGFLKPVHVTIGFVVLDYLGSAKKG